MSELPTRIEKPTPEESKFIKDAYAQSKLHSPDNPRQWFNHQLEMKYGQKRGGELLAIIHQIKMKAQKQGQQAVHVQSRPTPQPQQPPSMQHTPHQMQQTPQMHAPRPMHVQGLSQIPQQGMHLQQQHFSGSNAVHNPLPSLQNISGPLPAIPSGSLIPPHTNPSPSFDISSGDSFLQQHSKLTNTQLAPPAPGFLNASPEPSQGRGMSIQQSTVRKNSSPAPKSKPAAAAVVDPTQNELEKVSVDEFVDDKPGRGSQLIVLDADVASEEAMSTAQMRDALTRRAPVNGVQVPGVAARVSVDSGMITHRSDPPEVWNLLHQTRAESLARKVLRNGITISQDAIKELSSAVQLHLSDVVECSYNIAKKRINKTLNDQFQLSTAVLNSKHGDISGCKNHMQNTLALKWGPDVFEYLQKKHMTSRIHYKNKLADLHDNLRAELQSYDDERKPQRKRNADDSELWWKKQESDEKNGLMSFAELAMAHFKKKVAEVNELGPYAKKKSRKNEDKDDDKPDTKPMADRYTSTVDMTSSDKLASQQPWAIRKCPLSAREYYLAQDGRVEQDGHNMTTVIINDVINALGKMSSQYSGGGNGQAVGNALRQARTTVVPYRRMQQHAR